MNLNLLRAPGKPLLWLALALAAGCSRHDHAHHHPHGADDAHVHEEKTIQFTVWTNRYEIFAEHPPVAAGEPVRFVTHVTDIESAQPRREGPIRFVFRQGAQTKEHSHDAPDRPGIYLPYLTFPAPGEWAVTLHIPGTDGETVAELPPVRVYATSEQAAHAPVLDPLEGIAFLKEQQWKIGLKSEPVTRRSLVERLPLPAKVSALPNHRASVVSPVSGQLLPPAGGRLPQRGDAVKAGQTLALIQPSFSEWTAQLIDAQTARVKAKLELDQAEAAYQRIKMLAEAQAKTERELEEARLAYNLALVRHEAAIALTDAYQKIGMQAPGADSGAVFQERSVVALTSPINGVIVQQPDAALGEFVTQNRPLFSVLDASTVFVEAQLPETRLAVVGNIGGALFSIPASGQFHPLPGGKAGKPVYVGKEVSTATRIVPVVYEAENFDGKLRPGQSLMLHVETGRAKSALAVPDSAIVEEGGLFIAFVQLAGETFEKRTVKLGLRDGNWVQALSGLEAGDRVVTRGAYVLRLASVASVIPPHHH